MRDGDGSAREGVLFDCLFKNLEGRGENAVLVLVVRRNSRRYGGLKQAAFLEVHDEVMPFLSFPYSRLVAAR
jgi:hypothetical protein